MIPKTFILDLDGVLTDGSFLYSKKGKSFKSFGPDDHEALNILARFLEIVVVTADKKGFKISKRRVEKDMRLPLYLVDSLNRTAWIQSRFLLSETIYMGDGLYDSIVFEKVGYSIAPANSLNQTKQYANYVTENVGGNRAVAEACIHILNIFYSIKHAGMLELCVKEMSSKINGHQS